MNQLVPVECEQIDEELRRLIDLAPEAVFLAHRDGQLIYVNEAACELSGYMRSALLKRPIDRMLAVTWPHEEDEELNPAWQRGRLDPVETWLLRADGSWLAVEASALLLPGRRVQIWVHDISTRKTVAASEDPTSPHYTQEQLRSAVQERERILAIVAHDLRSSLDALMAHAAIAHAEANRLAGGGEVAAQAASMTDIAQRMSGLVKDLLSIVAAGTNAVKFTPTQGRVAMAAKPGKADIALPRA